MRNGFGKRSLICLALASALVAGAPIVFSQSTVHLDKHARKIHKQLVKYQPGSYLHFVLRNHTESNGTLETVSDASFTFTNTDTNARETHAYSDVSEVKKGKTYIGQGTGQHHHIHLF